MNPHYTAPEPQLVAEDEARFRFRTTSANGV